ncbi:MAG: hypothetical protein QXT73_08040 [Candidatus Methanomethylicaceae archaeon]
MPVVTSTKSSPRIDRTPQVVVCTDKPEYHPGSTITIIIRNETDFPIWYFGGGERFWGLERLDSNDRWVEVNFSFPLSDPRTGTDVCSYVLYEPVAPTRLEAQGEIRAQWYLGNFCEWPLEPIGVPTSVPKPLAPGTYRIVFVFGESFDSLEQKAYSEPFNIR